MALSISTRQFKRSNRSLPEIIRSITVESNTKRVPRCRSSNCKVPASRSFAVRRSFSSSTRFHQSPAPISYPYASQAITQNSPLPLRASSSPLAPAPKSIQKAVLPTVHESLKADLDPTSRLTNLFKRGSPTIIPSGSVLIVETWSNPSKTSFNSFSGVLISVRRRGLSTSFVIRNLVLKLGVEIRFNLYSPLLKDIKVVQRANASKPIKVNKKITKEGKMNEKKPNSGINSNENVKSLGLRRTRRAQLYYLRKDDRKLNAVGNVIKKMREEEERKKSVQQRRRR